MADNIWDKFDKTVDTKGLANDVAEAAKDERSFEEVPHGKYEVAVTKMELVSSKKGDPMVSIWFKIVGDSKFKGSLIFFNQVITQGFQLHIVNELLRAMDSGIDIKFETYNQYGYMLMDVFEAIEGKLEFALAYEENSRNKDFSTYEITEVFEVEN